MGNAGDGDVFDADHGGHAAAHVHEGAEGLQVGHGDRENHAGLQGVQQIVQGHALGAAAGEDGPQVTGLVLYALNCKGNGLTDPCENRNLAGAAVVDADGGLLPGHHPGEAPHGDDEVVVRVA